MNKIIKILIVCVVLFQVPLHAARGRGQVPPIRKIAVVSLLDDAMCVYYEHNTRIGFDHSSHLNGVIQEQYSTLLSENFEVVPIENWESRIHQQNFIGMKNFWRMQENCDTIYQMVQESQVDAILFIHPFERTDPTTEKDFYTPAGGGGFLGGFIAGALKEAIKQSWKNTYMTAPEIWGQHVQLHMDVDLYDVRGWRSENPQIHPKLIKNKKLIFIQKYREDRISSKIRPTSNDQMMMCEVIRLCLEKDAISTLSSMKLYPKSK